MDDEDDYFRELAYLCAQKDIENWWEYEEELKKQKPAKVELLTEIKHDKSTINTIPFQGNY